MISSANQIPIPEHQLVIEETFKLATRLVHTQLKTNYALERKNREFAYYEILGTTPITLSKGPYSRLLQYATTVIFETQLDPRYPQDQPSTESVRLLNPLAGMRDTPLLQVAFRGGKVVEDYLKARATNYSAAPFPQNPFATLDDSNDLYRLMYGLQNLSDGGRLQPIDKEHFWSLFPPTSVAV